MVNSPGPGQISLLFEEKSASTLEVAISFSERVKTFQTECFEAKEKQIPLGLALKQLPILQVVLSQIVEGKGNATFDFLDECSAQCSKSLSRLEAAIDSHGLAWVKEHASSAAKGDREKSWGAFLEKARAFLFPPTPYLDRCLSTCGLLGDETLKTQELGPKFKDLIGVMPQYATVSSVNKPLLQEISPESVELCSTFTTQLEEKLAEHIASYKGTLKQLTRLNDKYKPLGERFPIPNS